MKKAITIEGKSKGNWANSNSVLSSKNLNFKSVSIPIKGPTEIPMITNKYTDILYRSSCNGYNKLRLSIIIPNKVPNRNLKRQIK